MNQTPPTAPNPPTLSQQAIAGILASPDRRAADRNNDLRRKPDQMLAFIGVRPGMVALDLSAGGGYTSELIARAVGPSGRVYGQSAPRPIAMRPPAAPEGAASPSASASAPASPSASASPSTSPSASPSASAGSAGPATASAPVRLTSAEALAERSKNPRLANIVALLRKFEDPLPPELASGGLDLVTLMFNYHDLGHMGVDRAQMNRAVFAGLKKGGLYVIADHSGRAGSAISESGTLHRIEEAFLRQEVEAAGFRLAAEGNFLRNRADPRDKNTPDQGQAKDGFVLKFIKP